MGMGKEILLIPSVRRAGFPSDRSIGFGVIRMHGLQACEIPLLWCSGSAVWSTAPAVRALPAHDLDPSPNCDHLARLAFSSSLPKAFTEHGAIMAANVLNSPRAVEMRVHVVRAFVRLREVLASHRELVKRVDELETQYDGQFKVVFDAIHRRMAPPETKPKRRIGFV